MNYRNRLNSILSMVIFAVWLPYAISLTPFPPFVMDEGLRSEIASGYSGSNLDISVEMERLSEAYSKEKLILWCMGVIAFLTAIVSVIMKLRSSRYWRVLLSGASILLLWRWYLTGCTASPACFSIKWGAVTATVSMKGYMAGGYVFWNEIMIPLLSAAFISYLLVRFFLKNFNHSSKHD